VPGHGERPWPRKRFREVRRRAALRTLLLGLGGLVWARPVLAGADQLRFADLYQGSRPLRLVFSGPLLRLRRRPVAMRGFMAPPLKPEARFFVLTARPVSLCPFCDSDASWSQDIVVIYLRKGADVPARSTADPLEVGGVLEVGARTDPDTGFVSQV